MNSKLLMASALLALALGAAVAAQSRPSFAGHWRPVTPSESVSEMVITQDATTLTIGHPHGDGQHRSTFDLTGQEHKSPNPGHPSDSDVSTTKWEGSALIIDAKLANGVRLTRRLSLERDGTLAFEATWVFPDGRPAQEHKALFRKQ